MIITNGAELTDEYLRRIGEGAPVCEKCPSLNGLNVLCRRNQIFKVNTGTSVSLDYRLRGMPDGWSESTCKCGKVFPAIDYEKIDVITRIGN